MYAKIQITGTVELVTGMHIGGSSAFSAIGAVDSPVVKDVITNQPMIPGSSFKGKMRTLLAKVYNENLAAKPDDDAERLTRLFGSAKKDHVRAGRIRVADMMLANEEELRGRGLQSMTEVKFENTINRITAVANPRQIERAVRGSKYMLDMIYEVDREATAEEVKEDFATIRDGLKLLEYDYLGGSGTRGYGKVKFSDLQAEIIFGELSEELEKCCKEMIEGV